MATRFTYFGFEYEILEDKQNEVALIDASNAQGRTFIPKEVEYNGQKYAVTQITGKEVDFRYLEHCDSKRHKNSTRYRGAFQPKKHDGKSYFGWDKNTNPIEIIIPNCVTKIGRHTFDGCFGLTSVSIPNNVVDIGEYAFEDCYKLSEITIPDSVTHIGEGAFRFCNGLISVIIPYGVINIGNSAFDGCYNLKMVTIENGVINIECGAFSRCPSLTSITIPSSVKTIGPSAFKGDSNYKMQLENVRIENEEGEVIIHPDAFEPNVKIEYVGKPKNKPAKEVKETKKQEAEQVSGVTIDLEKLIAAALVDGVVTDKERAILCKKVKEAGGDVDEFEMLLDARIYEAQQKAQPAALKAEMNKGESKPTPKPEQKKEEVKPVSAEQVVTSSAGGKTATYGVWKVCIYDDGKAEVYKNGELCPKSSPALREIAAEIGLEVNPEWRTSQLSRNVLKAMQ